MAAYRLSRKAAADLDSLYEYTVLNFGLARAQLYLNGLHERLRDLSAHPQQGKGANELATGLRRLDYQSHMVFYRQTDGGIMIVRVLHQTMDARRHL